MIFLPEDDENYLQSKGYIFEEKVEGNQNGLIIRNFELPTGKFNHTHSDLLILIPSGYPDTFPDMWFFYPDIFLQPSNTAARATESKHVFEQRSWQRWSRHFPATDWRAGIDGMHTFLKKVEYALKNAQ